MYSRYSVPIGKIIIIAVVVLFLLQGVPFLTRGSLQTGTILSTASNGATTMVSSVNTMLGWILVLIQPILLLWIGLVLMRIMSVLEKLSARLERNKLDVNLTLKKDY